MDHFFSFSVDFFFFCLTLPFLGPFPPSSLSSSSVVVVVAVVYLVLAPVLFINVTGCLPIPFLAFFWFG